MKTLGLVSLNVVVLFALAVALCYGSQGYEYIVDEHTTGLWHMNEGEGMEAIDASPNGFNGEIQGVAQWGEEGWKKEGEPDHSFAFDGNTRINVGFIPELINPASNSITIEAWVYPENLNGWHVICSHWSGPEGAYHFACDNALPQASVNTENGKASLRGAAITPQDWYHFAISYDSDSGDVTLYVDGKVAAEKAGHGGKMKNLNTGFDMIIGSKHDRSFSWLGMMDEVRISNIARAPEELSPNLKGSQSVYHHGNLVLTWGAIKER